MIKKESNIEMLRIVSMAFILMSHAHFFSFGRPDGYSLQTLLSYAFASFISVGVNCFALITGYFGTKFDMQKIFSLAFQCCFCVLPVSMTCLVLGIIKVVDFHIIFQYFWPFNYWYVVAYLGLLIFVPVLNIYIKFTCEKQQLFVLLGIYLFILLFDVLLRNEASGVLGGFSLMWLVFLYLLGRLLSKSRIKDLPSKYFVIVGLICVIIKTLMTFCHINGFRYSNPTILIESICVLLLFSKHKWYNKGVNYVASSVFMVYLLNMHPQVLKCFRIVLYYLYENFQLITFIIYTFGFLLVFFMISIAYDKIRLFFWRIIKDKTLNLSNRINNLFENID